MAIRKFFIALFETLCGTPCGNGEWQTLCYGR